MKWFQSISCLFVIWGSDVIAPFYMRLYEMIQIQMGLLEEKFNKTGEYKADDNRNR